MKKKILIITSIIIVVAVLLVYLNMPKTVSIDERTEANNLAITFTEFESPLNGFYSLNADSPYEYTKEGYVHRLAHFKVENIGKKTVKTVVYAKLYYGDGYDFTPVKTWYHVDDIYNKDGTKIKGGAWVNNEQEISPYDAPVEVIIDFMIPKEVAEGDEEMTIIFNYNHKKFRTII